MENKIDNKSTGTFLDNIHDEDYERPITKMVTSSDMIESYRKGKSE